MICKLCKGQSHEACDNIMGRRHEERPSWCDCQCRVSKTDWKNVKLTVMVDGVVVEQD